MTVPNLPLNLVEEIVSRVPLQSMRALRLTCKGLYTLSKTPRFMKLHVGKIAATREGETGMIVLMDYNLYLVSADVKGGFSAELKGKLTDQVKISKVFHSEGLVLCILKEDTRFVVWNPYSGEKKWIKPRYSYDRCQERFCYALGYVKKKSCRRSHKLLRFIDSYKQISGIKSLCYEIYDFDTDLWTNLDVTPHWRISSNNLGVSLKGNTYWCASERPSSGCDRFNNHLICFDFTKESFGPLMPLPFSPKFKDLVTLSCVREDKLSALLQRLEPNPYEVEIWITSKIEAKKMSWNKFLMVDTRLGISYKLESFFIDEEKKVAMGFDKTFNRYLVNIIGEAGFFGQGDLKESGDNNYRPCACPFVPSLVKIKQPQRGQRKKKRPFGQNMLRPLRIAHFTKPS